MPCRTLILSVIGFEQLLDVSKYAIFEKSLFRLFRIFWCLNQRKSEYFSRQDTAKQFSLLTSTYMLGLAHKFWFDLNYFLTFWNKLYLENIIRLFATINQRISEILSRQATANRFSILKLIYTVGLVHKFWLDLNNSLMLPRKPFLKKRFSLFVTFNQRNLNFFLSKAIVPPLQLIQHWDQFSAAQVS